MRDPRLDAVIGGCPCGFWSRDNCAYVQAVQVCRAPRDVRPMFYPDGTHTGDCAGCLGAQEQGA